MEDFRNFVHASAVILEEFGVLIRGASGTGKSSLALALVDAWIANGDFARLVGDDRVSWRLCDDQVVIGPHEATAGLAEWRGIGLLKQPFEMSAVVKLVVDLEAPLQGKMARLPEQSDLECRFAGTALLPRLRLPARETAQSTAAIMVFLHNLSTK